MLRSLALLPEMEIDELANLAQRVASAAAQAEEDEAAFEDAPGELVCCDVRGAGRLGLRAVSQRCGDAPRAALSLCTTGLAAVSIDRSVHLVQCCPWLAGGLGLLSLLPLLWTPSSAGCTQLSTASLASGALLLGTTSCRWQRVPCCLVVGQLL